MSRDSSILRERIRYYYSDFTDGFEMFYEKKNFLYQKMIGSNLKVEGYEGAKALIDRVRTEVNKEFKEKCKIVDERIDRQAVEEKCRRFLNNIKFQNCNAYVKSPVTGLSRIMNYVARGNTVIMRNVLVNTDTILNPDNDFNSYGLEDFRMSILNDKGDFFGVEYGEAGEGQKGKKGIILWVGEGVKLVKEGDIPSGTLFKATYGLSE